MPDAPAQVPLDRLQRWFLERVTHPAGVLATEGQDGLALEAVIEPSRDLSAAERIGIYAGMYFVRLREVLEEDFPALQALLGDDEATRWFEGYLVRHPSRHPNLNQLGGGLAAYLETEAEGLPHRAFAVELARLERAIQEVFDAPRSEPLTSDDLLSVAPEAWGTLRLPLVPATHLLALSHPVNAWYQAFREEGPQAVPEPQDTWLLLYRRDYRVWRLPLTRGQYELLRALDEGATLAEALERAAAHVDLSRLGEDLRAWFQDWSGLGLFQAP